MKRSAIAVPSEALATLTKTRLESRSEERCASDDVGEGVMLAHRQRTDVQFIIRDCITCVETEDLQEDPTESWNWEVDPRRTRGLRSACGTGRGEAAGNNEMGNRPSSWR